MSVLYYNDLSSVSVIRVHVIRYIQSVTNLGIPPQFFVKKNLYCVVYVVPYTQVILSSRDQMIRSRGRRHGSAAHAGQLHA